MKDELGMMEEKRAFQCLRAQMEVPEVRDWLQKRKDEGKKIDPANAEVISRWTNMFDPYDVCEFVPDEVMYVSRGKFARTPGSEIWVADCDLPEPTRVALKLSNPVDENSGPPPF
jgi:hypothetical protein